MNIKRYSEDIYDEEKTIALKYFIEYLNKFDPETPINFDKWG